eukprot:jgi/Antlo1/2558/2099
MYDAILSFPDYGLFLFLYHYSDIIGRKEKIRSIESDLRKRIEKVERIFNRLESTTAARNCKEDVCINATLISIPIGVVLGVAAFTMILSFRVVFRIGAATN